MMILQTILCSMILTTSQSHGTGAVVDVPDWAQDAIVYQVLIPRFRNGSSDNDMDWTRPWDANWTRMYPGDEPPLYEALFHRRYGGDLQGLIEKMPYLKKLGVNTIYLSPVFQAGSEHKYDTIDYRHIDDSLGYLGSRNELIGETLNPATWQWSRSDRLFLNFLNKAHEMGFRVIMDGVFNHVSRKFPQWQDVFKKGKESPYADWFAITDFGPPIHWKGWDKPDGHLVEFRDYGDNFHPEVQSYFSAIIQRWMDPDGDGDPSDGIDGWRLDAAEQVPPGFWRAFRKQVKSINPDALIVGEIWEDASFWLQGDMFDVVTNYRFSKPVIRYLAQTNTGFSVGDMCDELDVTLQEYSWQSVLGGWNLTGSHDTERCVSMLIDPVRHWDGIGSVPPKDLLIPDDDAWNRMKLAMLIQFTFPGVPMIYYGNEAGLYGGDDPYSRGPMWWEDVQKQTPPDDMTHIFLKLIQLRNTHEALRRGNFSTILGEATGVWAFERKLGKETLWIMINTGDMPVILHHSCISGSKSVFKLVSSTLLNPENAVIHIPPLGGIVLDIDKK